MIRQQIIRFQESVPPRVKTLLLRALFVFIGWMLLYNLLLKPIGIPDYHLTQLVASGTVGLLRIFTESAHRVGPHVFLNGVQSVNIAPQCNGLELIVLYLGFLICYPGSFKKGLLFAVAGTVVITFLNMVRCALLAWLYISHVNVAEFAHHFAFKLIIYGVVFFGWMLYAKDKKVASSK